eukprot:6183211-Pleurochrysis_carterae.AAC.4
MAEPSSTRDGARAVACPSASSHAHSTFASLSVGMLTIRSKTETTDVLPKAHDVFPITAARVT